MAAKTHEEGVALFFPAAGAKRARLEMPSSGAEHSVRSLGQRSRARKGRLEEWWGERNRGPCGWDTHARLWPQPLKAKGQSSISGSRGNRRQWSSCFPQACGRLAAPQLRVVVLDSHKTASEPRFHGPHCWGCHMPTHMWGHMLGTSHRHHQV